MRMRRYIILQSLIIERRALKRHWLNLKGLKKNIQQADIEIGKRSEHHNKGKIFYTKVNLFVPSTTVRMEKDAEDLYKSIDKAKDHLKVELEKMKEKQRQTDREEIRDSKEYHLEDEY